MVAVKYCTFNSHNTGTSALPDMYTRGPQAQGLRVYISGHAVQGLRVYISGQSTSACVTTIM